MSVKLSIIIPLFNTEKWIGPMIDSILEQSFSSWELIIVDDGSTDNGKEIVLSYKDPRIILIERDRFPKGAPTCRNIGFEHSSGQYIIFVDSDDLFVNDGLSKRVAMLDNYPDVDFGVSGCKAFIQGETLDDALNKSRYIYGAVKKNCDPLKLLLQSRYPFIVCTNIYRRDSLIKNDIKWDETVKAFQDFNFNFNCLNKNLKYVSSEHPVIDYLYRVGHSNNNITSDFISEEKFQSAMYLINQTLCDLSERIDSKIRIHQFVGFIANYLLRLAKSKDYKKCNCLIGTVGNRINHIDKSKLKFFVFVSHFIPSFKYKADILRFLILLIFGYKVG